MRTWLALLVTAGIACGLSAASHARVSADPIDGTWYYGGDTIEIAQVSGTSGVGGAMYQALASTTVTIGDCTFAPGDVVFYVRFQTGGGPSYLSLIPSGSCFASSYAGRFTIETFVGRPSFWFCTSGRRCYRFLRDEAAPLQPTPPTTTTRPMTTPPAPRPAEAPGTYAGTLEYTVRVRDLKQGSKTYTVKATLQTTFKVVNNYVKADGVGLVRTVVNDFGRLHGFFEFKHFKCTWNEGSRITAATFRCRDKKTGGATNTVTGRLAARRIR